MTWQRLIRGQTRCPCWSSLWAAKTERYNTIYSNQSVIIRLNWCKEEFNTDFCPLGEENTRGDPSETAGQSEVEPVWKALLQVQFDASVRNKTSALCMRTCFRKFSLLFCFRLLLLLYLLYIITFTLSCVYRPLQDAPENYTTSDMDKTIRVQKTLEVCKYISVTTQKPCCFKYIILMKKSYKIKI